MGSRAKKKKIARGELPESPPPAPASRSDWAGEEGPELSPRQERWLEIFFTMIVAFAAPAGFVVEIFGSWTAGLVCGVAGAIFGVVLVRRGDKLF